MSCVLESDQDFSFFHYVEPPGENWFENGHNNNYAKSHSETHLYLHDDLYTQF